MASLLYMAGDCGAVRGYTVGADRRRNVKDQSVERGRKLKRGP
jgi:hypothetical protein